MHDDIRCGNGAAVDFLNGVRVENPAKSVRCGCLLKAGRSGET